MTISDFTPETSHPSPAAMPRRRPDDVRNQTRTPAGSALIETLNGPGSASVIIDGNYRRYFAKLTRVQLAVNAAVARQLPTIVRQAATTATYQLEEFRLPSGPPMRIEAVPILGPSNHAHGVYLHVGTRNLPPPVGTIEWDTRSGVAHLSTAAATFLGIPPNERYSAQTLPELISRIDRWDDLLGFLALFDTTPDIRRWAGTVTSANTDTHERRHIYLAAAAATDRGPAVRAILYDISAAEPAPHPDLGSSALRQIPTSHGHTIGMIDIKSWLVYDWIADGTPPISQWHHHNPEMHPEDTATIGDCRRRLLTGTPTVSAAFRVRFSDNQEWCKVHCTWKSLPHGSDRPQALLDIVPFTQSPHDRTE
ncbi:GAF domain-containing protein [Nocardia sp. CA-128927]|uniref:GAF domain-containing protein n=1 Tax=Nocardia sp. CA-128927 TaxID=3239975 RepID=UPI003D98D7CE